MGFTHLHLHTQFSLLDGAIKVTDLVAHAKRLGMKAVAMTDHGNMFGAVTFYRQCKEAGIKAILGCEVYVAEKDRFDKSARQSYHLVLLARNEVGYRNLVYLVSMGYMEGFYYNPRVDKKLLAERSEGLIALTACLGGEIPRAILDNNREKAHKLAQEYRDIFEPGMFFLEIQDNGMPEQEKVNQALVELGRELEIPLVATNDCHYLTREDAENHEILMCVQTGKSLSDESRMHHDTDQFYFKSPEEMIRAFAHLPEAIANTERIAEMCNVTLQFDEIFLPQYETPNGEPLEQYLREVAQAGLDKRLQQKDERGESYDRESYEKRLEHELGVIVGMDFPGYFLIVWDFIAHARHIGVPVGPGRGSGAGSLVAYALEITDIDPLAYNLLFERFLNPERVNMPDFDIDFCMNRRKEVIRYVTEKYGESHVGQIVTFGSLKARGTVRDVARVLDVSLADADILAKLVPDDPKMTLDKALAVEPRLKALYGAEPKMRKVIDVARALEGLNRHTGMHAAGIVIGDKPIWEYVPVLRGSNGEIVTQFSMNEVEKAGLVKFDFLGLKTLTVLDHAEKLVRSEYDPDFTIGKIPLDDPKVFELISAGDTVGVFQLESSGFQNLLKQLKPDCFEDIIAAVALYRPGPLQGGMVDDFVNRKHGKIEVIYPHPLLKEVLRETYGVIVYQEQVMQIANILAGFSLGEADVLRRAMGKKKVKEMDQLRARFDDGAKKQGIDPRKALEIFDLMEKFAEYGFNKSHSAAYALIAFQTAYLKAHYPLAFMAAILTSEKENTSKVVKYIAALRSKGVKVKPPDVNLSQEDFTVEKDVIRFGLGAVKGIGSTAVQAVIEARADGPFESLTDFSERVDSRRVNRKVIESLVKCGAFDFTKARRDVLFASVGQALERGVKAQREKASGQLNMLDIFGSEASKLRDDLIRREDLPPDQQWNEQEMLRHEKACLGFYITGHPLDRYQSELKRYANCATTGIDGRPPNSRVSLAGVVAALRERSLKSGKGRMANVTLEDLEGQIEIVVFSKEYMEMEEILKSDEPLLVRGTIHLDGRGDDLSHGLRAEEVLLLADVRKENTSRLELSLESNSADLAATIAELKAKLQRHPGCCPVHVHVELPGIGVAVVVLDERWNVAPGDDLLYDLDGLVGARRAVLL